MRILVVIVLLLIVFSMGSALFHLMRNKGSDSRMLKMLAIRVALSVGLFIMLLVSFKMGWIDGKI